MIPKLVIVAFFGLCVIGALFADGAPLSLATDVGVTDEDACSAVQTAGPEAIQRLEASGFPHPTSDHIETYRLTLTSTREVKAIVQIDWANNFAHCLPISTETPFTVSIDMQEKAYSRLVQELRSVLETGEGTGKWGNYGTIIQFTDVTLPDGSSNWKYRASLAWWAAGFAKGSTEA